MSAKEQSRRILSVRLPESEVRRFKSLASSRGISLQQAVLDALRNWALGGEDVKVESLDTLRGSLSNVDVDSLRQGDREAEIAKDLKRV